MMEMSIRSIPAQNRAQFFLVVTAAAVNPLTGGGQRTRLFFEACARTGPTDLVVLGGKSDEDFLRKVYPEVKKIHVLPAPAYVVSAPNAVMRKINGARLMLSPSRGYASDPRTGDALKALAADTNRAVFVFRYARTYCTAGLVADDMAGHAVCVDVDDRDDQKYLTYLGDMLGHRLAEAVFTPTSIRSLQHVLRRRLALASVVWFAASEDVWPLDPAETGVVPNVASVPAMSADVPPAAAGRDVLFVGTHGHTPNRAGMRWFLRHCWPGIAAAAPDARLRIVGAGKWETCASWAEGLPRVDLVGRVENLGAEYARARVAICPVFQGGGSKIKVLEAAAFGRPVVASTHSARGFEESFAAELTIADRPDQFVHSCVELLQDGPRADQRGAALREVGQKIYSKPAIVERLSLDLRRLITS